MLLHILVLNFVGVRNPKPMHGFSSNFQDMFYPRGFKVTYVLGIILLPWQCFYVFGGLRFFQISALLLI